MSLNTLPRDHEPRMPEPTLGHQQPPPRGLHLLEFPVNWAEPPCRAWSLPGAQQVIGRGRSRNLSHQVVDNRVRLRCWCHWHQCVVRLCAVQAIARHRDIRTGPSPRTPPERLHHFKAMNAINGNGLSARRQQSGGNRQTPAFRRYLQREIPRLI